MKNIRAAPALIKLSSGEPPTEFRLFKLGLNTTTKGEFTLDPDDAQACLDAHAAYANDLSIDWGHGAFEEAEGKPQSAAGWIGGLELRPDGLYAVRVTWTETAAGMIKRREQRYFSPAFSTDADGHIRSVINCALTLIPATHGLIPLVASRLSNSGAAARKLSMKTKYLKAAALLALADEIDGNEKASDDDKAMSAKLRKLAEEGEELKLAEGDDDEEEKTSDDEDEEDKDEKKEAASIAALARSLTGKTSSAEVAGVLHAFKASREQIEALSSKVAKLEASNRGSEVADLISKASRAGKLAPAQKQWATEYGQKDLAGLRAYLDAAPVLVSMKDGKPVETASADPGSVPTTLSADQEKILKSAGVTDPKAYAAFMQAKSA